MTGEILLLNNQQSNAVNISGNTELASTNGDFNNSFNLLLNQEISDLDDIEALVDLQAFLSELASLDQQQIQAQFSTLLPQLQQKLAAAEQQIVNALQRGETLLPPATTQQLLGLTQNLLNQQNNLLDLSKLPLQQLNQLANLSQKDDPFNQQIALLRNVVDLASRGLDQESNQLLYSGKLGLSAQNINNNDINIFSTLQNLLQNAQVAQQNQFIVNPFSQSGLITSSTQLPSALQTTQFVNQIPFHIDNPQWGNALADRVLWLGNQHINTAELHLNPPDLGPLEVRINVNQDQTSVIFSSQNLAVRDALENALPRLRDILQSGGLNLAGANVSDQSFSQQRNTSSQHDSSQHFNHSSPYEIGSFEEQVLAVTTLSNKLVDFYA
ncbi:MAG: hypothetical protein Tsb005_07420 [Gammaproteobacteria bacterium]